jgi:hypothetical protein
MEAANPEPGKHRALVESDFLTDGWWASCTCGEWKGPIRDRLIEVNADIADHFESLDPADDPARSEAGE